MSATLGDLFSGWPPQVLDPAGPEAAPVATMTLVLAAMGVSVTLLVILALRYAFARDGAGKRWVAREQTVLLGGLALPVIVLTALLVYGLTLTNRLIAPSEEGALRIRVIGEQWWWRVVYLDGDETLFETANEIVIPVGAPVLLELESADVIHSLWIPQLSGKLDMIPGRRNVLRVTAAHPGLFGGQCAEYCGGAHTWMKFSVRALPAASFSEWLTHEASAAEAPATPAAARGARVFVEQGCGECHAVRGVSAGVLGPDLTHMGARATVAAGMFPMSRTALARWIAEAQQLKPGNRMPSYNELSEEELGALAAYLEGLE